jgi:hypothetical protein
MILSREGTMRKWNYILIAAACLLTYVPRESLAEGAAPAPASAPASTTDQGASKPEPGVTPGGYTYNPAGRRDPFVSLLIGRTLTGKKSKPGLEGMLISEVSLVGIAKDVQGYICMLSGSDSKTYFVRVGAQLADGKIINITQRTVTFREEIKDPFSTKPFRDIEKSLNPGVGVEEEKR